MNIDGTKEFDAPREVVWAVISDPEGLAGLLPGVQSFEIVDDTHWKANVKLPLGVGGLALKMEFTKLEEVAPEFSKLSAKGRGVGAMVSMEASFRLEDGSPQTVMRYDATVKIAGPVGSMGQRVFRPILNQQVGNVLEALDQQVRKTQGAAA